MLRTPDTRSRPTNQAPPAEAIARILAGTRLLNTSSIRKETHIEAMITGMLHKVSFVVCWRHEEGRAWLRLAQPQQRK